MPDHSPLIASVEAMLSEHCGHPVSIDGASLAGGGCINNAQVLSATDGRQWFLKSNPAPLPGMFEREAEALKALSEASTLRVPRPVGTGGGSQGVAPYIVMEHIASGRPASDFSERFGQQFAQLHLDTRQDRFGFEHDNYIGSTTQPNGWSDDWIEFWRERRLGHQLALARSQGYADSAMNKHGDRLMDRLEEWLIEPDEPACLLHGDLWGGNYMVDAAGEPVLIDPAAYYGRREADLAMTMIFGGFDGRFYRAYEEVWPLPEGSQDRLEIYKLYHYLNHLNLFGGGYYSSCMAILRRYG